MAERGRVWSDNEIAALLAVWGEDSIQRQLLGSVRNVVPYRAIAEALRRQGYDRDFKQCREKIKGLKKKYKETVDSLRRSGVGVESDEDVDDLDLLVSFKWFAEIHGVLGRRAVVSPPSLIDSSNFSSQHSGTSTAAVDAEQSSSTDQVVSLRPANAGEVVQLGTPANAGEVVQLGTPAATESEDLIRPRTPATDQPDLNTSSIVSAEQASTSQTRPTMPAPDNDHQAGPSSSSAGPSATAPRPKKRKLTKMDRIDKANKALMDTFLAAQEESRQEIMEVERQRMAWDRQQAQEANEKEECWMSFMRDMFSMFAAPMPPQPFLPMYGPMPPHIPHAHTRPGTYTEEQSHSEEEH